MVDHYDGTSEPLNSAEKKALQSDAAAYDALAARLAEADDKLLSVAIELGTTKARLAEASLSAPDALFGRTMLMVKRYVVYAANCICDAPPNSDGQYVLVAAAPDLLALAHQYASECGECAGTRVCPDDAPCTECGFIWDVINKAEGKS